jgi:ribosome-associated protein
VLLDLAGLSAFAEHFVVATVDNVRQARSVLDAIGELADRSGGPKPRQEGEPEGGWVLIDIGGGVIVHLFSPESRAHYNLEGLWHKAQEVVRIQ